MLIKNVYKNVIYHCFFLCNLSLTRLYIFKMCIKRLVVAEALFRVFRNGYSIHCKPIRR
jgi:hypothetical protein